MSVLLFILALVALPARAEDFDAPFAKLGELPKPTVSAFKYKLSLQAVGMQGYIMQGRINGTTTRSTMLRFRAESPERIPGSGPMRFVSGKTTVGDGVVDFAAMQESILHGMPEYPPDKPAATFRSEMRRLLLVNDEVRVRFRFKDATAHYLVRYEDDVGLRLVSLAPDDEGSLGTDLIEEFRVHTESDAGTTWHCNALTTWATEGDKVLWSTDVPMEGQPKSIKIVGDVLLITTTARHSFYARKDTGEVAFYDKSVLEGGDPVMEVLTLGRANMVIQDKRRSLARFIYAAVVLDDRRAIPFLIDCIDEGDGLPVKSMAIAALEKFNGHPEIWAPPNREPGDVFFQWIDMKRTFPEANRKAEIAKWRELFADELKADQ